MSFLTEANDAPMLDELGREIVHFGNEHYAQLFKESRDPVASLAGWEFLTAVGSKRTVTLLFKSGSNPICSHRSVSAQAPRIVTL